MSADDTPTTLRFTRRRLPHWLVADRTYFVTLRLAGTIPQSVLVAMEQERRRLAEAGASEADRLDLLRRQFVRVEAILDSYNPDRRWLTQPRVARAFLDALPWLEGPSRGWNIHAATVMGTHAHLVMRNVGGRSGELLGDLGQFKRRTAREGNRMLARSGAFWAREDFDHWCRTRSKVIGAVRYIANNPVAAGLCSAWRDWPWTVVKTDWVKTAGL